MATECDENDESIGDILRTNDQCERIINQYRSIFDTNSSSFLKFSDDVKLVNISHSVTPDDFNSRGVTTIPTTQNKPINYQNEDLIGNFGGLENGHKSSATYDPLKELQDLFLTPNENKFSSSNTVTTRNNVFEATNPLSTMMPPSLSSTLIPMSTQKNTSATSSLDHKSLDESSKLNVE